MPISLEKVQQQAPALVSLVKEAQVNLRKRGLVDQKAKVTLVLDFSGSMASRYRSGEVQRLAERILALATQLDDDGEIDVFIFESKAHYLGTLNLSNYHGGIDRLTKGKGMGTTDYAGAFRAVSDHFFGGGGRFFKRKVATSQEPVYALFLTDGVPDSQYEAEQALTEVSAKPIFWKMISVGSYEINFLQKLDDLTGRVQDNADYKHMGDVDGTPDSELFYFLLDEYSDFVASSRSNRMIP